MLEKAFREEQYENTILPQWSGMAIPAWVLYIVS